MLFRYMAKNVIPDWDKFSHQRRVEVEFLFKLYFLSLIYYDQLNKILQTTHPEMREEIMQVVTIFENPCIHEHPQQKAKWSQQESTLLMTCYVKFNGDFDKVCSVINWRTKNACKMEFSRICKALEECEYVHKFDEVPLQYTTEKKNENTSETYLEESPSSKNTISRQLYTYEKLKHKRNLKLKQLSYARSMKFINLQTDPLDDSLQNNLQFFNNEFTDILLDAKKNLGLGNGKRYSSLSKTFWIRLRLYSRKSFKMMQQFMEGPSESTVNRWVQMENIIPKCSQLEELGQIDSVYGFWKNKLGFDSNTNFTISVDAAKIDENFSIASDGEISGLVGNYDLPKAPEEYKANRELYIQLWNELLNRRIIATHIFIFILCPITEIRGFPIFVKFWNSGSAVKEITNCLDYIIDHFTKENIKIRFIGSDADPCYRKRFDAQFEKINNLWNDGIINLNQIPDSAILYSNDVYHCLKRMRKSIINNGPLYLKPNDFHSQNCVDKTALQSIDKTIPDCVFRSGSMTSMDDYYPAALFKWTTFNKSRKTNNHAATLYLLIGVLARKAISAKHLTRHQRCILCYIGLFLVLYYKMFIDEWIKKGIKRKTISRMILSSDLCVDLVNYFTCMIKSLTTINDSFPLSRIGSIVSEHYFGRLRRNAENSQTMEAIRATINKLQFIDFYRNDIYFEEINHRRKLDTAVVENSVLIFNELDIIRCKDIARYFLHSVHLFPEFHFSFYDSYMQPLYNIEIDELLNELGRNNEKNKKNQKRWVLNAAQFRVNSRYGRNIIGRYITSAKPEKN